MTRRRARSVPAPASAPALRQLPPHLVPDRQRTARPPVLHARRPPSCRHPRKQRRSRRTAACAPAPRRPRASGLARRPRSQTRG
eukprot:361716-Chlamydomonas_euryale.AAC.4